MAYSYGHFPLSLNAGVALVFFLAAHTFWSEGRKKESRAEVWLGATFLVWGLLEAATAVLARATNAHGRDLSLDVYKRQV